VVAIFDSGEHDDMNVAIIGTGYVGLVTGACLANIGHQVICVDTDAEKIEHLQAGQMPFYEPGLEALVHHNQTLGQLTFTTDLVAAVQRAPIVIIAVGTPKHEDGSADIRNVLLVAKDIATAMVGYTTIVNKSTVPVGTTVRIRDVILGHTILPFTVVSNPEFLKQGDAIHDFMRPDRIVIGTESGHGHSPMRELYAPLHLMHYNTAQSPLLEMDWASAELCKYASNAMLATRISFMNEIARVCDHVGANVDQVRRAMGADRRIGPDFLRAGVGYGGSCFPKDVAALIQFADKQHYDFEILQAVERINGRQKMWLFEEIYNHFNGVLSERTVAVWGLAFKPDTDDMREAPAIPLIEGLLRCGARVQVYDPQAMTTAKAVLGPNVVYAGTSYGALCGAEALAVVTEWEEFRDPDGPRMQAAMASPTLFDGRNLYDAQRMRAEGWTYYSIGRPFVDRRS